MTTKAIRHVRVLDYYDEPLVLEARDDDGHRYLCETLDTEDTGMRFLVVPISDEQVEDLNRGGSCMRQTMTRAGRDEWYISVPQWDFREPFAIERQTGPISESPDLCGEGYMLTGAWDD